MEGIQRRDWLVDILKQSSVPISGTQLAKRLGVSRQIIVQDIALLRAAEYDVVSTTKGYLLYGKEKESARRRFYVRHTTDQIEDELKTIVNLGGKVLDVIVKHDIYGEIRTELVITTEREVIDFVHQVREKKTTPLKELTDGMHIHTVEAVSEEILDQIETALKEKKYLIPR